MFLLQVGKVMRAAKLFLQLQSSSFKPIYTPGKLIWLVGKNEPFEDEILVGGWTNPFEKHARQIGSFPHKSGWT